MFVWIIPFLIYFIFLFLNVDYVNQKYKTLIKYDLRDQYAFNNALTLLAIL